MQVVFIVLLGLFLLFLLSACYRWYTIKRRLRECRQDDNDSQRVAIAVVTTSHLSPRSFGRACSEEVGSEMFYDSAYPPSHQLPPYTTRPPPYEIPPVFPDEPPPPYASIAREERRQHHRIRIATARTEGLRTNSSTSA